MARKSTGKQRRPATDNGGERRRRFGALGAAWTLLVVALAGVVGWLALAPPPGPQGPPPAEPERTAEAPQSPPEPAPEATPEPTPEAPAAIRAPDAAPGQTATAEPEPEETPGAADTESGTTMDAPAEPPAESTTPAPQDTPSTTDQTAGRTADTTPAEPASEPAPEPAAPEPAPAAEPAQPPAQSAEAPPSPPPAASPTERKPLPGADQKVALAPAPDPALIDRTTKGLLPIIGPDGRKPWQVYRRPFSAGNETPRIAILIVGLGLSQSATNAAIQQLPGAVTLGFAPYAQDLQHWIEQSRAAGHEVMLQLPMEPYDYPRNDPGPHTLLTSLQDSQNIDRLEWLLSRFTGYVGVTNFQGAKFTTSERHLRPVMTVLANRGLMFLDLRATDQSAAARVARDNGVPRALNNRFLDSTASRSAIDARLNELERIAASTGTAVGVGFAYPVTIERVANWAPTLAIKGIALAPVTATVNRQEVR